MPDKSHSRLGHWNILMGQLWSKISSPAFLLNDIVRYFDGVTIGWDENCTNAPRILGINYHTGSIWHLELTMCEIVKYLPLKFCSCTLFPSLWIRMIEKSCSWARTLIHSPRWRIVFLPKTCWALDHEHIVLLQNTFLLTGPTYLNFSSEQILYSLVFWNLIISVWIQLFMRMESSTDWIENVCSKYFLHCMWCLLSPWYYWLETPEIKSVPDLRVWIFSVFVAIVAK